MVLIRRNSLVHALRRTLQTIEEREKLRPDDASLAELKRSILHTLAEVEGRDEVQETPS